MPGVGDAGEDQRRLAVTVGARPSWLVQLLAEEVDRRIAEDPRTVARPGTFLGYPKDEVFSGPIGWGQADFDAPFEHLSGDDRALLYAKYNQPRHLDELIAAFGQLFVEARRCGKPTVIDYGCGPFTGGLALAAALRPDKPFRYFGVDRYASMRRLGELLANSAARRRGLAPGTSYWFGPSLDTAHFGTGVRADLSIVVASYLLASPSLDVAQLIKTTMVALKKIGPGPAAVLYTNSSRATANAKYYLFRDGLRRNGFEIVADATEVFHGTKNPKELRYALFFRKPTLTIPLRKL